MERIYDDKGNWWVIETINGKKTWVMHNYRGRSVRKYGPDGYTLEGYDRKGFDRNGVFVGKPAENELEKMPQLEDDCSASQVEHIDLSFEKVKTYTDLNRFWEIHPYLTVSETYRALGKKKEVLTALLDVLIDLIHNDPTNIELLIRSFSPEHYDLDGALSWIRWLRKFTDKADRIKTYEIEKHMKEYSARKLYPGKYTVRGKEYIITEEDIKRGEEELKAAKRFVCAKTLKEVCFK